MPFQFSLSTRAGCESIAHVVQTCTDVDPRTTLLSIDGAGAFDLISRRAMLTALHDMPDGTSILHSFCNSTATHRHTCGKMRVWSMRSNRAKEENKATLWCRPFLHLGSIGRWSRFRSPFDQPRRLWLFMTMCTSSPVPSALVPWRSLWNLSFGSTPGYAWTRGKLKFGTDAGFVHPTANTSSTQMVNRMTHGGWPRFAHGQARRTPLGHAHFVQAELAKKIGEHGTLLERIRKVPDLQCAWASMHMISTKDLNSAEMDTLTKSCSPTIVRTANGEVKSHSFCQRIGFILDCWRPRWYASSLIARKALRWTRIFWRMDQRSKTRSHLRRDSDTMQHGKLRSDRGSWHVSEFFLQFSLFNINDTFKEGDWSSYVFLKLVYLTNYYSVKRQWE